MIPRSIIFLFLLTFISCEKDDICLEGTPATPMMIVLFKDHQNPEAKKGVSELLIRGIDREEALITFTGDSVALPLRNNFEFTQYELTWTTSTPTLLSDTIQINHRQFDIYLNRACGYKSTYIFEDPSHYMLTQGAGWIEKLEKIKDTITDEKSAHLAIYH